MKTKIILTALLTMLMFALVACQTDAPTPPDDKVLEQGIECQAKSCEPDDPDPSSPPPPPAPCNIIASASDEVTPGTFMTTEARLCVDGFLKVRTQTQTMNWFEFNGYVLVRYLDADGTVLGTSSEQNFWVDGIVFGTGNRSDRWSEMVSASILSKVSSLQIAQSDCSNIACKEPLYGIVPPKNCYWCP